MLTATATSSSAYLPDTDRLLRASRLRREYRLTGAQERALGRLPVDGWTRCEIGKQTMHALADRGLVELRVGGDGLEVAVTERGATLRARLDELLTVS